MKNIPEEPRSTQLLPNTMRIFRLSEGGHVQVGQNNVHVFWKDGQAWHVPIHAPLPTQAPRSKKMLETEMEHDDAESTKEPKKNTVVFMKDASRFAYTTPIPASIAKDRQPLESEQAHIMARVVEEIRGRMGWAPLVHVWNEQRVRDIGPPTGMKDRRNEAFLEAAKPRVIVRKTPEPKKTPEKKEKTKPAVRAPAQPRPKPPKAETRPPKQIKPQIEKPAKEKPQKIRRGIFDRLPGLQEYYTQGRDQQNPIKTHEYARRLSESPWFTEYALDTLRHAGYTEPETQLPTLTRSGQKHFAEHIKKSEWAPKVFASRFSDIRSKAIREALKELERKK